MPYVNSLTTPLASNPSAAVRILQETSSADQIEMSVYKAIAELSRTHPSKGAAAEGDVNYVTDDAQLHEMTQTVRARLAEPSRQPLMMQPLQVANATMQRMHPSFSPASHGQQGLLPGLPFGSPGFGTAMSNVTASCVHVSCRLHAPRPAVVRPRSGPDALPRRLSKPEDYYRAKDQKAEDSHQCRHAEQRQLVALSNDARDARDWRGGSVYVRTRASGSESERA